MANFPFSFLALIMIGGLFCLASCRPEHADDKPEASTLGRQSLSTSQHNPILDYLVHSKQQLPPGGKRQLIYLHTTADKKSNIVTDEKPVFQRDPNKSPLENFNGFIMAGRKPEDGLVQSGPLAVKSDKLPAFVLTTINSYDENSTLRTSLSRYEPLMVTQSNQRQQITWPYAGYFPVLIKDPFLTLFHTLAAGKEFSLSSLVEYGPDADICRKTEHRKRRDTRSATATGEATATDEKITRVLQHSEETGKRQVMGHFFDEFGRVRRQKRSSTRITVSDPDRGLVTVQVDNPLNKVSGGAREPKLSVRKGGVSLAGPNGFATAYTGGTAIVGPYGTVFKSPGGLAIAGPYSRIINITDSTSLEEILAMYKATKLNKTVRAATPDATPTYRQVKKLFSMKWSGAATVVSEGGVHRARQAWRTINDLDGNRRKQAWKEAKATFRAKPGETTLVFAPRTRAEAGENGIAISSPISHAVIHRQQDTQLVFQPDASASAGPGGFAHSHSDLFVSYT